METNLPTPMTARVYVNLPEGNPIMPRLYSTTTRLASEADGTGVDDLLQVLDAVPWRIGSPG